MDNALSCALDIGEQMLLAGAEVHRAEDTVQRICTAFGAARTDIFIITSSIVATLYTTEGDSYTQTRRITGVGTDLERLHQLNALSRRICAQKLTPAEARREYLSILPTKRYPFVAECAAYAAIAGAFTLFFGGTIPEALVSAPVGLCVRFILLFVEKRWVSGLFAKGLSTFLASALAYIAVRLELIPTIDMVIIGNIMTLIPGIGLTNALRDLFVGDSIAGLLRLTDAALHASAIAGGYLLFNFLIGGLGL